MSYCPLKDPQVNVRRGELLKTCWAQYVMKRISYHFVGWKALNDYEKQLDLPKIRNNLIAAIRAFGGDDIQSVTRRAWNETIADSLMSQFTWTVQLKKGALRRWVSFSKSNLAKTRLITMTSTTLQSTNFKNNQQKSQQKNELDSSHWMLPLRNHNLVLKTQKGSLRQKSVVVWTFLFYAGIVNNRSQVHSSPTVKKLIAAHDMASILDILSMIAIFLNFITEYNFANPIVGNSNKLWLEIKNRWNGFVQNDF
uniref:Uncharacterized protein n=1 Tax=Daphnia galeata TaxID=27404 RepID=A0A8J2RW17_9CRUS|nr:unnamed protein product [Daphnia galeata]